MIPESGATASGASPRRQIRSGRGRQTEQDGVRGEVAARGRENEPFAVARQPEHRSVEQQPVSEAFAQAPGEPGHPALEGGQPSARARRTARSLPGPFRLAHPGDEGAGQRAVLSLHRRHPGKGGGERKLARVAGEDPGDHGVHQDLGRLEPDAPPGEFKNGLVVVRTRAGKGLAEQPQAAGQREDVRCHEGEGRRGHPPQPAAAEDETIGRTLVGVNQVILQTDSGGELESVGGVVEKALRALLEGEAVLGRRADLAAGGACRLEDHGIVDPVVSLEPLGGGEPGDAAADDGDAVPHSPPAAVKSASSDATAVTPVTIAASSGRNVGVWT